MLMIAIYSGNEIREIRKALDMTPTDFGSYVGVSASAVCRWEKGNRLVPKVESLRKINELAAKAIKKGLVLQEA